jgi:proteasome lid subunit RPN8/RPN11
MDRIPIYPDLAGTFHSHPTPNAEASRADLKLFGEIGKQHIIFGYPYNLNSFQAYDSMGKKIQVKIV